MASQAAGSLAQIQQLAQGSKLALVHFWASWCQPCQQMDLVITELTREHPGVVGVRVEAEVVDEASIKYNINSVPTVVLLQFGEEVTRVEGADPAALTSAVVTAISAPVKSTLAVTTPPTATQEPPADTSVNGRIKYLLATHPVCLFMVRAGTSNVIKAFRAQPQTHSDLAQKGTVDAPRCGFSSRVVKALQSLQVPIKGVNILSDEPLRAALKAWSNWPTYPQLYIKGELVGGCDIVEEMQASGELKKLLEDKLGAWTTTTPAQAQAVESKDVLTARLQALVKQQPVMLFMKGTPENPRCGFSRKVAAALQSIDQPFGHFDILSDEVIRSGLKEYSSWPTYPQLYVGGELLGGCDIVLQMQETGELKSSIEEQLLSSQ